MGAVESIRSVFWARQSQRDEVAYMAALAHERFRPPELLGQAVAAEQAGFDGVCCSDHLAPWWEPDRVPAACGNAWVWLGAASQATDQVALGSAVTAVVHRYNPVVVAQQVATLGSLAPGRAFLGVGSGEAMNEVAAGMRWPSPAEQLARTAEALEIISRLLDGQRVDFEGEFFRAVGARLYLPIEHRPPIFMSAFGPEAAAVAGRYADGIWTLADPTKAPEVIAAYRGACEEAGREPGEVILQTLASWAPDDERALEDSKEWKPTLVDANYSADLHEPVDVAATANDVSDAKFKTMGIISSDPDEHVRKIEAMREMGPTAIVIMNISGGEPDGMLGFYGSEVLPRLRC